MPYTSAPGGLRPPATTANGHMVCSGSIPGPRNVDRCGSGYRCCGSWDGLCGRRNDVLSGWCRVGWKRRGLFLSAGALPETRPPANSLRRCRPRDATDVNPARPTDHMQDYCECENSTVQLHFQRYFRYRMHGSITSKLLEVKLEFNVRLARNRCSPKHIFAMATPTGPMHKARQ